MAEAKASLILQLKDLVSSGLDKIGTKLEKMSEDLEKSKFVFAGTFAAIVGGVGVALHAFGEEERAIASLNQALLNQGIQSAAVTEDLRNYASAMQHVSNFADDQIIAAQAQLVQFGLTGQQLKEVTKATLDLAAAKGIDLTSAAQLLGKAFVGETAMLGRYGIVIDDSIPKSEKFAVAMKMITDTMGGQALAQQQTFLGSITSLKNTFGDFLETIGSIFAPIIQRAASSLQGLIESFLTMDDGTKKIIAVTAGAVAAFTGLITAFMGIVAIAPAIGAAWAIISGPIGLIMAGIVGVAGVTYVLISSFEQLKAVGLQVVDDLSRSFSGFAEAFTLLIDGNFKEAWQRFKDAGADAVIAIGDGIRGVTSAILEEGEKQFESLNNLVNKNKQLYDQDLKNKQDANKKKTEDTLKNLDLMKIQSQISYVTITQIEQQEIAKRDELEKKSYETKVQGANDYRNFMIGATNSQFSAIRGIAKAFMIQETIMNTHRAAMGAYAALAGIPFVGPALGAAAAAAAIVYGAERVANIAAMADGGLVMPSNGGTIAQIGEAGSKEAVIPLNDSEATNSIKEALGGGGATINIQAGVIVADKMSVREFAKEIDEALFELRKNRQSVAF